MLTPEQAVFASILSCVAGALLTLLLSRNKTAAGWLAFVVTTGTAVLVSSAVYRVLTRGPSPHACEFWAIPKFGFALRIHVDGLTAAFLLLACLIAVPASFYSITFMRRYRDYGVARYYPYFLLFLGAVYGLVSTTDMIWFFFIFWQLMTLSGYALIRFEHRKSENRHAANKYLMMMQIACAVTMVGVEILAVHVRSASHSPLVTYDFEVCRASIPLLLSTRPDAVALVLGLFLVGFGIKMGMWPFGQLWLPDAHPAAPSPVSALHSGVMIKTGVYGLMRYFLWLVPANSRTLYPLAEWGMVIAILGTITLFIGTMQALRQENAKRLLAFHSIGQIGYMLLGTGACMALLSANTQSATALATIGFVGALLHVVNHGLFKGLLFLNAGSMLYATGTQDLNQWGGLMKYMPLTAITALVASFSISGVPLFNGFVSKWSIYVASVQGVGSGRYLPICAAVAILTSALTLASFVKFFGVSFLSRTSALVKAQVCEKGRIEVSWIMQLPQLLLAFFCVLLGIVPAIGIRLVQLVLATSPGGIGTDLASSSPLSVGPLSGINQTPATATFVPITVAAVLGITFLISYGISKIGGAPRRAAEPWLCGYAREAECHRYVAHNFYGEVTRHFRWLGSAPRPTNVKQTRGEDLP